MLDCLMGPSIASLPHQDTLDQTRMRALIRYTARTLETASPVPFGALIVDTLSGAHVMRAVNAVRRENDPSSHAELRTVRLATRKRANPSLKGCTLYSTCEPCPMCMANALWAGLDRVVYGATIEDANRHCRQIRVSARELVERSDMSTIVDGPLLRDECYALFTHPNMLRTFATWNTPQSPETTSTGNPETARP
jgi:tRNA(Arg) A34 adenosine deaminase TadA